MGLVRKDWASACNQLGLSFFRLLSLVIPLPESLHGCSTPRSDSKVVLGLEPGIPVIAIVRGELLERIDRAALEDEVLELGKEWGVLVVHLVSASGGGPVGAVPYGGVEGHGLGRVVRAHRLVTDNFSDRDLVDIESA